MVASPLSQTFRYAKSSFIFREESYRQAMPPSTARSYTTATLAKGLEVLEALAQVESAGLSELARRLELSVPTLFRILATLVERGFVQKHETRYRLSLKTWQLGAQALGRFDLVRAVRPWMQRLAEEADESPHLALLQEDAVVIVERGECRQALKVETALGLRVPAHATATGKAILAHLPEDRVEPLLNASLAAFTPRTLVDRAAVLRELAKVRRLGYATNRGEWRPGVSAVAVPLLGADGQAAAALSFTLPTERFGEAALKQRLLPALRRVAEAIARERMS